MSMNKFEDNLLQFGKEASRLNRLLDTEPNRLLGMLIITFNDSHALFKFMVNK